MDELCHSAEDSRTNRKPVFAVVTPYYREETATLERCINSVRNQSQKGVLHFLVADGFPRCELMDGHSSVRHITLANSHNDNGDTPRGVGALCALNEGVDVVCFLDADNFYEMDHVASVAEAFALHGGDVVISERTVIPRGHPDVKVIDPEDAQGEHVDTSCLSFAASAAFLWPVWALIPKELSPVGDRIMISLIKYYGLRCTRTGRRTVVFESNYSHHFRLAGLPNPVYPHEPDMARIRRSYDPREGYSRLRLGITV